MALQPAFQVVTRILNTNHPFWIALLNLKSRRNVSSARLAWGAHGLTTRNWSTFTLDYDPTQFAATHPQQVGPESIKTLDRCGYDLPRAAAEVLAQRLRLSFFSCVAKWKKGKTLSGITWGLTDNSSWDDPSAAGIDIFIGAEMVWPLLIPELTPKEKASCTMMIAVTMLHELAVSIRTVWLRVQDVFWN
jgi:hypothetical protein